MSRDKGCPACECGESLATSVYVVIAGQLRKSCTLCSRLAGEHLEARQARSSGRRPRAPRAYDQADRYEVGDRITQTGPKILAHGRVIEVRADLIELVRDYGEPLTVDEVASYCAIEIDDALRQLNALIRAGVVVRAGVCRYTYAQESRAA